MPLCYACSLLFFQVTWFVKTEPITRSLFIILLFKLFSKEWNMILFIFFFLFEYIHTMHISFIHISQSVWATGFRPLLNECSFILCTMKHKNTKRKCFDAKNQNNVIKYNISNNSNDLDCFALASTELYQLIKTIIIITNNSKKKMACCIACVCIFSTSMSYELTFSEEQKIKSSFIFTQFDSIEINWFN